MYSIKTNLINSFFSKFFVKFLRNSIKYTVSEVVLGRLWGPMTIETCTFETYDYSKHIIN